MQFDFSIPDHPTYSFLYPEDLKFFYYDINFAKDCGIFEEDSWEKVMKEFSEKVDINVCARKEIPEDVNSNTLRFTKKSYENEIAALFRHLRNAFAHHRIHRMGEAFFIEDKYRAQTTMIGRIECELLMDICLRFLDIHQDIVEQYSDSTNPLMDRL
ncbi:MAG: hypothetical protein HDS35_07735 [Bacteroides sp.]|nr:hypothetical protein [Bacteroides sp.]